MYVLKKYQPLQILSEDESHFNITIGFSCYKCNGFLLFHCLVLAVTSLKLTSKAKFLCSQNELPVTSINRVPQKFMPLVLTKLILDHNVILLKVLGFFLMIILQRFSMGFMSRDFAGHLQ